MSFFKFLTLKNSYHYTHSFVFNADIDGKLLSKPRLNSPQKRLFLGVVISSLRTVVCFIDLFKAKAGMVFLNNKI
jgi:hypothetical protein